MLVGYMRVSSNGDRQTTTLQRDALLVAGIDGCYLHEDQTCGVGTDRPRLARALKFASQDGYLVR